MTPNATALAELRWLIEDPPLLRVPPDVEDGGALLRQLTDRPRNLRRAATALSSLTPPRRLGHHFENLVATALAHSERFEVVARNLALRDSGATLGELDLLVRDRADGALCHWELALKFYLGLPGEPGHEGWPGPDPRDQLSRKASHLYNRQLRRSQEPTVAALLAERGWTVQRRVLLTRGRLFYPMWDAPAAPDVADPEHRRGEWWRESDAPDRGRPVPHSRWHLPTLFDTRTAYLAGTASRDYLEPYRIGRQRSPEMLVTEDNRIGFLVPDHWPAPTEA